MSIQESGEMYLENILILSQKQSAVRAIHIAEQMGFSKAAVSRGLNKLREEQLILTKDDGAICLTEKGHTIAKKIYERHVMLADFFKTIGVDEVTAARDACRIEHVISDQTFNALIDYAQQQG